jgi:hypothetical protein
VIWGSERLEDEPFPREYVAGNRLALPDFRMPEAVEKDERAEPHDGRK